MPGALLPLLLSVSAALPAAEVPIEVGVATRDITPEGPVWLSGYAARNRASEAIAQKLMASAIAFRQGPERLVLVTIDNCEVNQEYNAPVLEEIEKKHGLAQDEVIIVSSHTHSGPCLPGVLSSMFFLDAVERERVEAYSRLLRGAIVEVVGGALADLKPARLETGKGWAGFAMNRRVFRDDRVDFGEDPVGPVDEEVPVLKISAPAAPGEAGEPRAILFGYACHGTTIAGADFYRVSGDYMAYAREHIEAAFPGATAAYLTGCGADTNPSPRGSLALAKRHGLELAGAVAGVLARPMRPVRGPLRRAFARIDLPLAPPPDRARLDADSESEDRYVQSRARRWLAHLDAGKPLPTSVSLPLSVVRFGNDLTFFFIGGEVVVDYALRLKHEFPEGHTWTVGYAHEVPCYIPSGRILREGGYEADSSLIYYGIYGPFLGSIEGLILGKLRKLVLDLE
ncbi:MAG TPA: neutral/alkaline non-lysosomal ceramidase N-terminal domain-containing protein [Planctomycetota bacterium]|nr:neutral/alkaline non-lysosomal ceramidase N-terminal domain-containing protein [Planctomycetota bacterium]